MKKIIAIYLRLSSEDDDKDDPHSESGSISNQRDLLVRFIRQNPEFADWEIREFADDGFTGANENRPAFQEMIAQIKRHSINAVAVKDFSRFARNYITVGEYLEQVFPFLGIRFISVNDHYDSKTSTSQADTMSMILKSILNAYYCKEISKKIRATCDVNMRNHQSLRVAPFGYVVNEARNGFDIDPEPASTVREIFRLSLTGLNFTEVAKELNHNHVPTPSSYNLVSNWKRAGLDATMDIPLWRSNSVQRILRDPVYTGRLTLHKSTVAVPSSKRIRPVSPEEQYVFEDAHEPIISKEDFTRVQELHPPRKTPRKKNGARSIGSKTLTGYLFCGVCKRLMMPTNTKNNAFYCMTNLTTDIGCRKTPLPETQLEQAVLSALLPILQLFCLPEKGNANGQRQIKEWLSECQKEILHNQIQQENVQKQKLILYEQYIAGEVTLLSYQQQKLAFNHEIQGLEEQYGKLKERESTLRDGLIPLEWISASKTAERLRNANILTREMVTTFIDRVDVFPDYIHIKWKFQDIWRNLEDGTELAIDHATEGGEAADEKE